LLLCSKDAGKQREASAEVAACSPTKIAAVDVVLPLVRLLASNDVIVLRNACRALKNITETLDDARAAALNADALPALISVISRQRLWVQEEAAEALRTITTYNSTRASPIDVSDSAGEALVALLQSASVPLDVGSYHDGCSHDRNKHVRQALLLALINVTTTGDGECSAMVVKRGPREPKGEELAAFLEKPCRLLREGNVDIPELAFLLASADTTVQSQAARALGHFCADMARCKLRFSVAGVGSSLASGSIPVHLNSTNVGVQIRAALSVCFAANDSDRRDVIRAGVVPVLVRLLDSAHVGLQAAAVCALANILDIGSSGSKAADWGPGFAMDGTIVSALGRLLASNRNNAGVQKRAMSALTRTKLCPMLPPTHYDDAIRGVVPLLASTNAHLRIRAVITISSIADCEEHRAAAVSANAVPLLVRLLGSISVDTPWAGRTLDHLVLRSAVAAIRWLTQDVEPARRVARDDGAVRALIRLLAAHDVSVLVDAAYVLKHVVVRAGVSTGVVREAVPALEAILRGFRYSGHDVSVVRDVLAGLWRAEDAGVIV
jgi:hypothetical protein